MKGKILTILMSLALVFTMMPMMADQAYAGGTKVNQHDPYEHANNSRITQEYGSNTVYIQCDWENDGADGKHVCRFSEWPLIILDRPDSYYDGKPKEAGFVVEKLKNYPGGHAEGFPYDYAEWDGKFIYTGVNGTVEYGPTDKAPIGEGTYYVYAKVKIPSAKTLTSDGTFILGKQFTIEPSSYNVTFDANPPKNASTTPTGAMPELHFNSRVEKRDLPPNQFVLPGYTFDGWNTKPDGTGTGYVNNAIVSGLSKNNKDITLYAQWNPKTYTITYKAGEVDDDDVTEEVVFDQPGKLKPIGEIGWGYRYHGFLGWSTDGFGIILGDKANYVNLGGPPSGYYNDPQPVELTAQWVGQGQIVVSVTKDGVPQEELGDGFSLISENGTVFTMRTDYLDGMYTLDTSKAQQPGRQPAALPPDDYELVFESNGYEKTSQHIEYDGSKPVSAVFDYYTVSTEKDPAYSDKITSLVLEDSEGTIQPVSDNTFVVPEGRKMKLQAQVAPGYHFGGYDAVGITPEWEGYYNMNADQTIEVQGQAAIMAHVEANTYKVHFDANTNAAVIGKMEDQDMVYDEEQKLFANKFMCSGAEFTGWNTKKDGSGQQFADKESVKNLTDADGGTVTLYAQWNNTSEKTAILKFDLNGGTLEGKKGIITVKETVGKTITMPAAPTRKGYTFKYWKGSNYKPGSKYKVTGDHKFTAVWSNGPKASGVLLAKMTSKGSKSLVLTWNKIDGAAGYDVFFVRCGDNNSLKKVKTIKGNKTLKWTKKNLRKKTSYKAVVKAWVKKNGKKTYVSTSPAVHAYTSGGKKYFTNPEKVTVKKVSVSLKKGKKYKIKASVANLQKGKALIPDCHEPELRYISSNKKIATVSKSGKITAKGKGKCKVYVLAINGVRKAIKVTVK